MYREEADSEQYKMWRDAVYARDGYKCRVCDKKGYLNAHHLNSWSWYVEGRYDIDNGVTLCFRCHKEFHDEYGKKNNTFQQFEIFMMTKGKIL